MIVRLRSINEIAKEIETFDAIILHHPFFPILHPYNVQTLCLVIF
jgi:hypothetical protein